MTPTKPFHFIGIGGIGMSGLARILLERNISVSGSDLHANYITDDLEKKGAKIFLGHAATQIPVEATVVYSTDIKLDNPELQAAKEKRHILMHRSDLLLQLMQGFRSLAVAGTHGKTTTSSLLTWVLHASQTHPSFAVGGIIPQLNANAGLGMGEYFVIEADESDGTFLKYHPFGGILTNIDSDHLNYFGSMDKLKNAFKQFIQNVENPSHFFWCGEDPYLHKISPRGISYGYGNDCQLQIISHGQKDWGVTFDILFKGIRYENIFLSLIGSHNVLNGAAVFGLALTLGISENSIRQAFKNFGGVKRRCEKKGEKHHVLLLDDYAHHPTEIQTTLQGIRKAINGRRLIAIFQPHRYSRTQDCLGLYKGIFNEADEVFVTDIFAAGESPIADVTVEKIVKEIESDGLKKCHYAARHQLAETVRDYISTHDVIVTLGAGDITKLSMELLDLFEKKPPKKLKVGIVFGGRSTEHEITFLSTQYISQCVSPDIYDVQHFGVSKEGQWVCGSDSLERLKKIFKDPSEMKNLSFMNEETFKEMLSCDLYFPVFHGPYGEDGTIQGFFETLGKAYAGPDHLSAAISMDKAITKSLMYAHGIATLPFVEIDAYAWKDNASQFLNKIQADIQFPVFIKPVHLGSTVGVQKVENPACLRLAIEEGFKFDYKLIVEQGLTQFREIEFAALGNERALVFPPGEVFSSGYVYDFDAKYGPEGMKAAPKAALSDEKIQEGVKLALAAYKAVGGSGMARVDFFLDSNGKFWLNEINPIPGFTQISLYPKICEVNGINGKELINRLIISGLERKRRNSILCRNR